jgi:hypothetical protein
MPEDYEYFANKRPDRTYVSSAFERMVSFDPPEYRKMRILSKVFDSDELHQFALVKNELVLRITPGGRQEVKIVFYEDPRELDCLTIQRYTRKSGKPQKWHFTFRGEEIDRLCDLIRFVQNARFDEESKTRIDDHILDDVLVSLDEKRRYFLEHSDLVMEIARNDITKSDIVALAYRKKQLEIFEHLLNDEEYFEATKRQWGKHGKEAVWQQFFEDNSWIFGYGLSFVFTSALDDQKLEQLTTGYSVQEAGKRVDALMRTRGLISSLCFVEIKTHTTPLLSRSGPYRVECWPVSDELVGSVSQVQKTVQKAMKSIQARLEIHSSEGDPTGEVAFLYQPKAYVVIGSLGEFLSEHGVNEQKFSSFELFRRNMVHPEVITFDELYERARFIVKHSEEAAEQEEVPTQVESRRIEEELVFEEEIPF